MNIQLTISLLASDRMETLGKCLDSITPLLSELSSELIIVFTGKDPAVTELAGRYTSHIIPFTWCNDFSKARNAGLKEAKGEWFLYLDDDEWFEDTSEIIRFFKSGECNRYQSATYIQRNYRDFSGKVFTDSHVGRMCRLTPETKFIYPIHENLDPVFDPQKRLLSFVHHYGYVGKEVTKSERNLPLLLKRMEDDPSAQTCMQITQEYRNRDELEDALRYCRQGLKLAEKESRIHNYELWLQVHLVIILASLNRMEEALKEGERVLLSPRTLEVGEAHLHAILAEVCWELKEYKKGLMHSQKFHRKMRYLQKHPDKAMRQVGGTITFDSAKERTMTAYVAGLLFAAALDETDQIKEILTWFPWEDEGEVRTQYGNLESWKWGHPEHRETILEGYYHLETENAYVNLQKALYAEMKHMTAKAEEFFRICAENCPSEYMYQLVELAERNGFSLSPLLKRTSIEAWDECAKALTEYTADEKIKERLERLWPLMSEYPICAGRLKQHFLEKLLAGGFRETEELLEYLRQYCESVRIEADILYKEEILSDPEYYGLPYQCRFALIMERMLEGLENKKYAECIPLLKKGIRAYPQMSVIVGRLSEYLEEKMKEPMQPVSEEFNTLGRQVKQLLLSLMEQGQWQEAYGVAEQLTALLPGDPEVVKLKQEIIKHIG